MAWIIELAFHVYFITVKYEFHTKLNFCQIFKIYHFEQVSECQNLSKIQELKSRLGTWRS